MILSDELLFNWNLVIYLYFPDINDFELYFVEIFLYMTLPQMENEVFASLSWVKSDISIIYEF